MPDSDPSSCRSPQSFRRSTGPAELGPIAYQLFNHLAGPQAERAINDQLLPVLQASAKAPESNQDSVRDTFEHPFNALHAFFAHYAFARRGKDRDDLSSMAVSALRRVTTAETINDLLKQDDGSAVWEAFCQICIERRRKNSEQLNRGLIAGMIELAQEIYALDEIGSITGWIADSVEQTDRIEAPFLRIVDIRGVGPKTTSTFLRDMVLLFELEDQIDHADRLYVQPVDRWLRLAAPLLVPEANIEAAVDWVIAGKIAKYARRAGVSGIRLNIGNTYFGSHDVREPGRYSRMAHESIGTSVPPTTEG